MPGPPYPPYHTGPALEEYFFAYARERGVTRLYATGELARETVAAFGAGALHVDDVPSLAALLQGEVHAGVTALVKGSRFMRMERVVAALAGQPAEGGH